MVEEQGNDLEASGRRPDLRMTMIQQLELPDPKLVAMSAERNAWLSSVWHSIRDLWQLLHILIRPLKEPGPETVSVAGMEKLEVVSEILRAHHVPQLRNLSKSLEGLFSYPLDLKGQRRR